MDDEYSYGRHTDEGGHCLCGQPLSGTRYGAAARLCWECRNRTLKDTRQPLIGLPYSLPLIDESGGEMPNINDAFPSKYLKADDLKGNRILVTIDHVSFETVGDDENKAIVYFRGKDKGLVLNRTNAASIVEITGSAETDDWHGHRVVLFPTKVDFQGKRTLAIRIDNPPKGKPAPPPPPPAEDEIVEDVAEDEVPF